MITGKRGIISTQTFTDNFNYSKDAKAQNVPTALPQINHDENITWAAVGDKFNALSSKFIAQKSDSKMSVRITVISFESFVCNLLCMQSANS